jgi:hypothetical protein
VGAAAVRSSGTVCTAAGSLLACGLPASKPMHAGSLLACGLPASKPMHARLKFACNLIRSNVPGSLSTLRA